MSQNEQGMLYPFRLSGSRMRQSATQLRRQGKVLDALALLRRAAEQDDSPAAWQALAEELCRTANWESAVPLLARVLSRDAHQPGAWIAMANCMRALGHDEVAVDCAYHQLQDDPWCPDADAAREILDALDAPKAKNEPRRTQRLIHRGMSAWQRGDRALGERRIRRALRLTEEPSRLLVSAGMLCALEMDHAGAMGYLARALRRDPADARILTAMATLFYQAGKARIAKAFLGRASQCADTPQAEDSFLTAAWAQDAWPELAAHLARREKRQPHRVPLLTAKAMLADAQNDPDTARQLRREILSIDPDDHTASMMLAAVPGTAEALMSLPGMLPRTGLQRELNELKAAAESEPLEVLLRPGSRTRRIVDWFLTERFAEGAQVVLRLLSGSDPAAIPCLKELICRPFLSMEVRQWALLRLAELGCEEELLIMTGSGFSVVACQKRENVENMRPWRTFLPLLLIETRRYRQSADIAEFAADIWSALPEEYRFDAAYRNRYVWVKAIEVLFLRMAEEEKKAAKVVAEAAATPRKISRVLRKIYRCFAEITDQ